MQVIEQTPDHPRIRGEHTCSPMVSVSISGSSPHTRGAPSVPSWRRRHRRIIPAYAGSTFSSVVASSSPADHPRIRGEHPGRRRSVQCGRGSSPHTRGARLQGLQTSGRAPDHPRIRGEHMHVYSPVHRFDGSSPHTRGALVGREFGEDVVRIIPAYAGSTMAGVLITGVLPDHPRIRGEHDPAALPADQPGGSSPHTRGAPARPPRNRLPVPDHPRIRGEHKSVNISVNTFEGSSPHTRGALEDASVGGLRDRIIPAYAGSTPASPDRTTPSRDHPRIRGEHKNVHISVNTFEGSSPHTRGAPHTVGGDEVGGGIIPAYAGSTTASASALRTSSDHPRIRGEHGLRG